MGTLSSVELGVLGPLQVRRGGASVVIPGAKPRAILTMLGLHCGSVVPADALVELLWGLNPPRTAAKALQTHISSLRRSVGDGFVLTQGAGWVLAESEVDASRYKAAARLGRDAAAAGDTSQALARFEEALALWRGIPELPDGRRGTSEKTRWIEGHAALIEDRADALLATGRAAEVIGDLEAAVAEILADGSFVDDRRRVVNIGVWHGRDVVISNIRALAEVAPTITSAVLATRGDRLALLHICAPNRALRHGEFGVEMLGVAEIDTDGRMTAHVLFDPDDVAAAIEELDARYLAGEAAAHADAWSVVSDVAARFNRHKLPATTPDPVYIDRRPLVSIEGADLAASIRAVWDITSDSSVYIEAVHQLSERGAVFTEVLKMTSQEGFDAEVRMIMLFAVEGDLINRVEIFDEADLDLALARFDNLTGKDQPK